MVGRCTEQPRLRERREKKALMDASWALRRLVDKRHVFGRGMTLYAVCEVMDRAAMDISGVEPLHRWLLALAQSIQNDARADREGTGGQR